MQTKNKMNQFKHKALVTEGTKDFNKRLIREFFDGIDTSTDWGGFESEKAINAAKELGYDDLAEEMENDLKTELQES